MPASQTRLDRLKSLHKDLGRVHPFPWSRMEEWINKANPIIRHDFPDHFDEFKRAAADPKWIKLRPSLTALSQNRSAEMDRLKFDKEREDRSLADDAKKCISAFIDGLLQVAEALEINAPDPSGPKSSMNVPVPVSSPAASTSPYRDASKVFVVHGRNAAARNAIFELLRAVGLNPLEWDEIVRETGHGSPYIGEVLKKGFEIAQATVVLMTPDDEARLIKNLQKPDDPDDETAFTLQPRQNVLLEAGMALGIDEARTIIVEVGKLRPISDTDGRHVVRMSSTPESRKRLIDRLKTAGCAVSDGRLDWLSTGDFDGAVKDLTPSTTTAAKATSATVLDYIEGLDTDELYIIAVALLNNTQTLHHGRNSSVAASLRHKGFIEAVSFDPTVGLDAPYVFPPAIWKLLRDRRLLLVANAVAANSLRPDRLKNLQQ